MRRFFGKCGLGLMLVASAMAVTAAQAASITFFQGNTARTDWLGAIGTTPTVITFEGQGFVNTQVSPSSAPGVQYALQGVTFNPFGAAVAVTYPEILTGQGATTTSGSNWLGNRPSIGLTAANAISFGFSMPTRAFGFFDLASDDGFEVSVFTAGAVAPAGTFDTQEGALPRFWGFLADDSITRVDIRPRSGNGFIGIDDLQFAAGTTVIPVPGALPLLAGGLLLIGAFSRRRAAA